MHERSLGLCVRLAILVKPLSEVQLDLSAIEESFAVAATRPKKPSRPERAATNLVIKALALKAYPDDAEHHCRMESKVCASLELFREKLSREAVAKKLKLAFATEAANDQV